MFLVRDQKAKLGPGASSRKTRIETRTTFSSCSCPDRPGASSRKTRIETPATDRESHVHLRPGASSRKTRIETHRRRSDELAGARRVRAQVPEKQGLKPLTTH